MTTITIQTIENNIVVEEETVIVEVGESITAHPGLSGLLEDNHPQYLNTSRGDIRYYTKTQIDTLLSGSIGGVTDHGLLTGLLDDDHTQYHNDTRGDIRYYLKNQVDTLVSGAISSIITDHGFLTGLNDDDHPQYLNNSRGDIRYYTKSEVDTLVSGATGTTDHGLLTGLLDNDHPQYALLAGSNTFTVGPNIFQTGNANNVGLIVKSAVSQTARLQQWLDSSDAELAYFDKDGELGLPNKAANVIFAGPSSGSAARPTFRSLVEDDIPTLSQSKITNLISNLAGKVSTTTTLTINGTTYDLSANRSWIITSGITLEQVDDEIAAVIQDTADITWAYDDDLGTLTPTLIGGTAGGDNTFTGIYGSQPSTHNTGNLFFATNSPVVERDTGAAWRPFGPLFALTTPPTSGWSWDNQGTSSIDTTKGGIILRGQIDASSYLRLYYRTAPSTPYQATFGILHGYMRYGAGAQGAGVAFRESSTGKIISFHLQNTAALPYLLITRWTNATTPSSNYFSETLQLPVGAFLWMRLTDNGTNFIFSLSNDKENWTQIYSVARGDFMTNPDQVALMVRSSTGHEITGWLLSYETESLSISAPAAIPPMAPMGAYKIGTGTGNQALTLGADTTFDDTRILHPNVVEQGGNVYMFYSGYDGSKYRIGVASTTKTGFTGVNFTKYGSNPILSYGTSGQWDEGGVSNPWVIYDADASLWKMWYVGFDASQSIQRIGYATASSPTGPWTKHTTYVLDNEVDWEGNIVASPCVIKDGSTYKMLYTGNEPASNNGRIGYATSSDGITWSKSGSNPVLSPNSSYEWMAASVFSPHTLVKDGSTYYMYFGAKPYSGGMSQIGGATSTDMITWTLDTDNPFISATRDWEISTVGETEHGNYYWHSTNNKHYIYYDAWFGDVITIGAIEITAT